MAHAEKKTRTVTVSRTVEVEEQVPDGITLHLSEREATVLKKVLQRVGGSPYTTARRECKAVDEALGDALGKFLVSDDEVRMSSDSSITMTEAYL